MSSPGNELRSFLVSSLLTVLEIDFACLLWEFSTIHPERGLFGATGIVMRQNFCENHE